MPSECWAALSACGAGLGCCLPSPHFAWSQQLEVKPAVWCVCVPVCAQEKLESTGKCSALPYLESQACCSLTAQGIPLPRVGITGCRAGGGGKEPEAVGFQVSVQVCMPLAVWIFFLISSIVGLTQSSPPPAVCTPGPAEPRCLMWL